MDWSTPHCYVRCMRRAKVHTGCRDCRKCTNSEVVNLARNTGRIIAGIYSAGMSEVALRSRRKCRICGHQMSLHEGAEAATPQPAMELRHSAQQVDQAPRLHSESEDDESAFEDARSSPANRTPTRRTAPASTAPMGVSCMRINCGGFTISGSPYCWQHAAPAHRRAAREMVGPELCVALDRSGLPCAVRPRDGGPLCARHRNG